jgi:hypothetical protein
VFILKGSGVSASLQLKPDLAGRPVGIDIRRDGLKVLPPILEKNYDPKEPDQIAGLLGWCRLFWRHLRGWALLMVGVIL